MLRNVYCGTYFTHVQTCNVTRVQSATEWTASVLYTCPNLQCNPYSNATEWTTSVCPNLSCNPGSKCNRRTAWEKADVRDKPMEGQQCIQVAQVFCRGRTSSIFCIEMLRSWSETFQFGWAILFRGRIRSLRGKVKKTLRSSSSLLPPDEGLKS